MSGTFATWQPEYEARGIATFPLRSDDRKRPAVGNYNKMGMPASRQLRPKWGDAEGLACLAGARNRITVVDIDARGAEGEWLLADVQAEIDRPDSSSGPAAASMPITATAASAERFGLILSGRLTCSGADKSCCRPPG